ncbi:PfkB family carbohydrate kinase [Pelagibacteraceae bacterium]|nr:PfkB family carbohydrate kinase [Pelagibacteraceae bacterium]
MIQKINKKIKKIDDLIKILKKSLNDKTILCHGCFDIVHPGHIRHLNFAKSKGKILIVSITSDKYINKGSQRPYVPEYLRAQSLANLEIVDYVIIDNNKKPLSLLKKLKPNFFAKGFEYSKNGLPEATKEEMKIVKSYGGKMIFTPGNIVYSSSKILNLNKPNIKYEKLITIMKVNKISFRKLIDIINNFKKISFHIVGDTIVDSITKTSLIGGQTKTPTISVLYHDKEKFIGGAAVVARHLAASGAKVEFTTVLGKDSLGKYVIENLKKDKIKVNAIFDENRPTTEKNAITTDNYRLLKIDTLNNTPITNNIITKISNHIKNSKYENLIFSDFRHGLFNINSINLFNQLSKSYKFKAADSQVASRWGNITDFKEFDLITPNEKEARFSTGDQDSNLRNLALNLHLKSNCKNIILKLAEKGIFSVVPSINDEEYYSISMDSFADNIIDPVGAGDALLAYASLSYATTNSIEVSSIVGSLAAAIETEKNGNIPVRPFEIIEKITKIKKILRHSSK